jgi:CubicO group peptidase (beta-lactamase class C family)
VADIEGSYDELFSAVPGVLAGLLDDGDAGGSVAVFVDGEPVVDVWGGFADADRTIGWQQDTITNVWSVTKTMTALCALVLADRGELDLAAPVGRYWPEFAVAGKDKVLVRHLLGHTAGLPDWDGPVEDLYDWPSATARLAAQAPQWEPGSAAGYHSLTQGFLVGEVVRRITGQSLGGFFAGQVAGPLGADFHIGLPAGHDHQVQLVVSEPGQGGIHRDDKRVAGGQRSEHVRAALYAGDCLGQRPGHLVEQACLSQLPAPPPAGPAARPPNCPARPASGAARETAAAGEAPRGVRPPVRPISTAPPGVVRSRRSVSPGFRL